MTAPKLPPERVDGVAAAGAIQRIKIADFPELRLIAWNRDPESTIDAYEALALYEANWRFVTPERMSAYEKALLARLIEQCGGGVLNV